MRSLEDEEIDRSDLLYSWYPLPNGEACHFWLRTAWDLIEDGKEVSPDVITELEKWGINAPEYIAWVETLIEEILEQPIQYRSIH